RALGIWAAVSAVALAIGPAVGGFLVDADWRLIFWINIPVSIAGIAIILIAAPESRDEEAGRQVDFPGLLTLTIGLGAAVLALVESDVWGWDDPRTPAVLLGGVAMLAAFWVIEHRVEDPIIDFSLFRSRPYLGATAAAFALAAAYWTVMFYQPQFLQEILGKSPVSAGLLVLPITVPMIAISPLSGRLIARFGARNLMTTGLLCGVAGLIFLTRIDADSSYAALMPGYLLFGIALGLVYAPMSTAAMAAMPRSKVGIASGVLAMARVLAGAVGLALSGAVFESLKSDKIASGEGDAVAFASALGDSSWVLVAIMALGTLGCWLLVPAKPDPDPDSAPGELQHRMHNKRFHL
ncbi:MAG: MFS transporter, partial [Solirubrobacterales bacterium]|nr:MFS transporter [Solirubrobacterales bacterium]